jgi:hypothetical protein
VAKGDRTVSLLLLFLTIVVTPFGSPAKAANDLVQIPVIEEFDLLVDGSITPQVFTPNASFLYLMRVIWVVYFQDIAVDFDGWGTGGPLTNGTAMLYDGISLIPDNITHLHEFAHVAYDMNWFEDDSAPPDHHFVSRFTFTEFVPDGLLIPGHLFQVIVQDNQTAAAYDIDYFEVYLEGYTVQDAPGTGGPGEDFPFRQVVNARVPFFNMPIYHAVIALTAIALMLLIFNMARKRLL